MQTPANCWQPSPRPYDPHPPRWEYPEGAWVLKIDAQGKLDLQGRKWRISKALAGEYVHLLPVERRLLVFFCSTLLREIDPAIQQSTIVDRWIANPPNSTEL